MGWMYAGTSVRNVRERRRTSLYRRRQPPVAALKLVPPRHQTRWPARPGVTRRAEEAPSPGRPIRFEPIEPRPLQPFIIRESACNFLECRASSRRCIAAQGRPVGLDYQIAYCLGERHEMCGIYRKNMDRPSVTTTRRVAYAAAAVAMFGLLALAIFRAIGTGTTLEMGRALGLG